MEFSDLVPFTNCNKSTVYLSLLTLHLDKVFDLNSRFYSNRICLLETLKKNLALEKFWLSGRYLLLLHRENSEYLVSSNSHVLVSILVK